MLSALRPLALAAIAALFAAAGPAAGQGDAEPSAEAAIEVPWQDTITGQIRAFREGDATGAFGYAGNGFQTTFLDAETFFAAIMNSGYAPIRESRSHSFGAYRMIGKTGVIQEVRLVGNDQAIYRAVYQLTLEHAGWRVQGVQMHRQAGVAI